MMNFLPSALSGPRLVVLAALALAVVLAAWPGLMGVDPALGRAAAVVVVALALWSTGVLAEPVTALAFFLASILLGVAGPQVVFSGFTATAFWLVFGGLLMGMAVRSTGLGERMARALVGRIGTSYLAVLTGIVLVAMALAFLMPSSMGRVVLLLPVVLSVADRLGYGDSSRGRIGMVLLTGVMSFAPPTAVLPAVVPNLVMIGAAETLYGEVFHYLPFLVAHLPVTGIAKALLMIALAWLLFREEPPAQPEQEASKPWSGDEKRLSVVLVAALSLWATDSLHGISPAWVALAGGLTCLLPLPGGTPQKKGALLPASIFSEKFNTAPLLHLAALLSLGAVVAESGLGTTVGGWLLGHLPLGEGRDIVNYVSMAGLTSVVGLLATIPGVAAVMTPLAEPLSAATGLPLRSVLMVQVVGYSTMILPYQVPPLIVAMQMGKVAPGPAARYTLTLAAASVLIIWPLTYLWWQVLSIL